MKTLFKEMTGTRMYHILLHMIVLAFGVELVVLARQNRELKERVNRPTEVAQLKAGDTLYYGEVVPVEKTMKADTTRRNLIFVFSVHCPYCKANIASWKRIVAAANARSQTIFAISTTDEQETSSFVRDSCLSFPTFVPIDRKHFEEVNRIFVVPKTIIRAENGVVEKVWDGLLTADQEVEVMRAISTTPDKR